MKNNKEILDWFGENLILRVFDPNLKSLKLAVTAKLPGIKENEINNIYLNFNKENQLKLINFYTSFLEGIFFEMLNIFEHDDEFKIVYNNGIKEINLSDISDMLKAELLTEDGWIARFSKELKNGNLD